LAEKEPSPEEQMTKADESPREASTPTTLLTTKIKARIGTWNIQILYKTGKTAQLSESRNAPLQLEDIDLCETRWKGTGLTRLTSGYTILYSGHEEGQPHMQGVGLLMTPEGT
jgi:hypothetical protein